MSVINWGSVMVIFISLPYSPVELSTCLNMCVCVLANLMPLNLLLSLVFSTNYPARAAYQVTALPRVSI